MDVSLTKRYLMLQALIELPYVFVQAAVYGVIVYAMIGFEWTAAKFFWYLFFMYFTLLYFTFYGMLAVSITPNFQVAAVVASAFYNLFNLFSGFLIPRPVSFGGYCNFSCFLYFSLNEHYSCSPLNLGL